MTDNGQIFVNLMHLATSKGITVRFVPFKGNKGRLKGDRLAINQSMESIEEINYTLAHEIAHSYLHYDKGDTVNSELHEQYEEQADRGAQMLLDLLST